ncbi:MAG: RNA polymerase sigma factor [Verrucomicrobia bacterium]|nr:RNA polymerase sigma factor [Verrucomicrobiota bacterium]
MGFSAEDDARSDEILIAAADDGDASAFETLYYRHRDWVVRLAYRFTDNRDDALDALQETFTYLARKLPGFRLTAKLTTFLYPVVKHTALRLARKRRRSVPTDEAVPDVAVPPEAGRAASRADLAAALATLRAKHREVLLLRFVDNLTLEEIAQTLRIRLGTVKSRLHNALKRLRSDPRTKHYFGL